MEHLALEIFDLGGGTGSKYANLPEDASITITDTSDIFASGDVWSHSFTLNIPANLHIFGTSGDIHGARLHEQINKRRARLWVEGLPLFLGYLLLGDEVEVDENGDVEVTFESGQKTFEEMIEGASAQEVSVGDVVIGVALNRKRVIQTRIPKFWFTLDGLEAYAVKDNRLNAVYTHQFDCLTAELGPDPYGNDDYKATPYAQRWPKIVKSKGDFYDENGARFNHDYTNVQTPYDAGHAFCNVNVCYQMKVNKDGEELVSRGYTMRLAWGDDTTDGGDNQTRYNNAPNFYLLHFVDRLFKDLGIHIDENQALSVEDLRRVFMLNYGCHYEEIEDFDSTNHNTPSAQRPRYGQYYMPILDHGGKKYLLRDWVDAGMRTLNEDNQLNGKVLLRDVVVKIGGETVLSAGSIEGKVVAAQDVWHDGFGTRENSFRPGLYRYPGTPEAYHSYSAYLAYATGENYPAVEISEIINAMKAMFGARLLFSDDFKRVRVVLLRNVLRSQEVQNIRCEIVDEDVKVENGKRGFRMTYGKGTEDTNFYYKGFNDLFPRASKTWKDSTDKHDYSQWKLDAEYDDIKQSVTAMNKMCYVTPVNGNAYGVKIDEDEDVHFPSLFPYADFMDAEDGDCSQTDVDESTVEEVQIGAAPLIMNQVGDAYAALFTGEMNAPSPDEYNYETATKIDTYDKMTYDSADFEQSFSDSGRTITVSGKFDAYIQDRIVLRMMDNYSIGNGGTPFDEADPGLQFGIMRGSGPDAHVAYYPDETENETPLNDWWEVVPGGGAIDHADTCDNYGNEWDYNGNQPGVSSAVVISTPGQAIRKLSELWPTSHAPFYDGIKGYITYAYGELVFSSDDNQYHHVLFATSYSISGQVSWKDFYAYLERLQGKSIAGILAADAEGYNGLRNLIIELDGSASRASTLHSLCRIAYGGSSEVVYLNDDGEDSRYGRFSLKLRAEKPNPYYNPNDGEKIISTKEEAGDEMLRIFTTAHVALLHRPRVSYAAMRAAGWNVPGDGYATVYSMRYGVQFADGVVHELLWTPIKANGTVLTRQELETYVNTFNGLSSSDIFAADMQYLILDIDTTDERAELLHELQALYYAEDGEHPENVIINRRYLAITNKNLRQRGLCDQFYKEYSYWVRNARIVRRTVRMELAQLLSIDKTKRVTVGDVTGFIRKMQYSVSNKTGLGNVTMEIMYI